MVFRSGLGKVEFLDENPNQKVKLFLYTQVSVAIQRLVLDNLFEEVNYYQIVTENNLCLEISG